MNVPGNDSYSSPYNDNNYSGLSPNYSDSTSSFSQYETSNYGEKSNWPSFLKDERNQVFYGIISIFLSFTTMILGIVTSVYYLFILDKSVPKSSAAKWLNIAALAIPAIGIVFSLLMFILLFVVGIASV